MSTKWPQRSPSKRSNFWRKTRSSCFRVRFKDWKLATDVRYDASRHESRHGIRCESFASRAEHPRAWMKSARCQGDLRRQGYTGCWNRIAPIKPGDSIWWLRLRHSPWKQISGWFCLCCRYHVQCLSGKVSDTNEFCVLFYPCRRSGIFGQGGRCRELSRKHAGRNSIIYIPWCTVLVWCCNSWHCNLFCRAQSCNGCHSTSTELQKLKWVPGEDTNTDCLTKSLKQNQFRESFRRWMGGTINIHHYYILARSEGCCSRYRANAVWRKCQEPAEDLTRGTNMRCHLDTSIMGRFQSMAFPWPCLSGYGSICAWKLVIPPKRWLEQEKVPRSLTASRSRDQTNPGSTLPPWKTIKNVRTSK